MPVKSNSASMARFYNVYLLSINKVKNITDLFCFLVENCKLGYFDVADRMLLRPRPSNFWKFPIISNIFKPSLTALTGPAICMQNSASPELRFYYGSKTLSLWQKQRKSSIITADCNLIFRSKSEMIVRLMCWKMTFELSLPVFPIFGNFFPWSKRSFLAFIIENRTAKEFFT